MYQTYFEQMHREGWQFLTGPRNGYRVELGCSFLNFAISPVYRGCPRLYGGCRQRSWCYVAAIAIYRDCSIPWVGMFIFVSFHFFGNSMSFIRQSFAIGIFLFAIRYLKEKRFVPYLFDRIAGGDVPQVHPAADSLLFFGAGSHLLENPCLRCMGQGRF